MSLHTRIILSAIGNQIACLKWQKWNINISLMGKKIDKNHNVSVLIIFAEFEDL